MDEYVKQIPLDWCDRLIEKRAIIEQVLPPDKYPEKYKE